MLANSIWADKIKILQIAWLSYLDHGGFARIGEEHDDPQAFDYFNLIENLQDVWGI